MRNIMSVKKLGVEDAPQQTEQQVQSPQQEKVALIDKNTHYFKQLLLTSIKIACLRLIIFFIIIVFEELFIVTLPPKGYAQSWNMMFYGLAAIMDFFGVLNDLQILRHLQKDQEILKQIKRNMIRKTEVRTQTQIGHYKYYLSMYDIIKKYKYRSKSSISMSETIRFLHVIITICIFGNLAINLQNGAQGQTFKVLFLWSFMLSIYLNVFQLDFFVLQNSTGPFIQKKTNQESSNCRKVLDQNQESSVIKARYIKHCRRPFQTSYIINILSVTIVMIIYFKVSLLNLMLGLCLFAHMLELIHEKHLQTKLTSLNLQELRFIHLSPYKIISQLTQKNRNIYKALTILTRILIVLSVFAYFKEDEIFSIKNFCMSSVFILLIVGQAVKFKKLDSTNLYILKNINSGNLQGECSICLLPLQADQRVYKLPCFSKHVFHQKCMKNWCSERKECPLCRNSLQIYQLE